MRTARCRGPDVTLETEFSYWGRKETLQRLFVQIKSDRNRAIQDSLDGADLFGSSSNKARKIGLLSLMMLLFLGQAQEGRALFTVLNKKKMTTEFIMGM